MCIICESEFKELMCKDCKKVLGCINCLRLSSIKITCNCIIVNDSTSYLCNLISKNIFKSRTELVISKNTTRPNKINEKQKKFFFAYTMKFLTRYLKGEYLNRQTFRRFNIGKIDVEEYYSELVYNDKWAKVKEFQDSIKNFNNSKTKNKNILLKYIIEYNNIAKKYNRYYINNRFQLCSELEDPM